MTLDWRSVANSSIKCGNVQNGHVYADREIVWLYLQEGFIEVSASGAELVAI